MDTLTMRRAPKGVKLTKPPPRKITPQDVDFIMQQVKPTESLSELSKLERRYQAECDQTTSPETCPSNTSEVLKESLDGIACGINVSKQRAKAPRRAKLSKPRPLHRSLSLEESEDKILQTIEQLSKDIDQATAISFRSLFVRYGKQLEEKDPEFMTSCLECIQEFLRKEENDQFVSIILRDILAMQDRDWESISLMPVIEDVIPDQTESLKQRTIINDEKEKRVTDENSNDLITTSKVSRAVSLDSGYGDMEDAVLWTSEESFQKDLDDILDMKLHSIDESEDKVVENVNIPPEDTKDSEFLDKHFGAPTTSEEIQPLYTSDTKWSQSVKQTVKKPVTSAFDVNRHSGFTPNFISNTQPSAEHTFENNNSARLQGTSIVARKGFGPVKSMAEVGQNQAVTVSYDKLDSSDSSVPNFPMKPKESECNSWRTHDIKSRELHTRQTAEICQSSWRSYEKRSETNSWQGFETRKNEPWQPSRLRPSDSNSWRSGENRQGFGKPKLDTEVKSTTQQPFECDTTQERPKHLVLQVKTEAKNVILREPLGPGSSEETISQVEKTLPRSIYSPSGRRSMFRKYNTAVHFDDFDSDDLEEKEKVSYSRDELISLADCVLSKRMPEEFSYLIKVFPDVCLSEVSEYVDSSHPSLSFHYYVRPSALREPSKSVAMVPKICFSDEASPAAGRSNMVVRVGFPNPPTNIPGSRFQNLTNIDSVKINGIQNLNSETVYLGPSTNARMGFGKPKNS